MALEVLQPASAEPMLWNAFPCFDLVDTRFSDHTGGPRVFDRLAMPGWQEAFLRRWGWQAPVPASKRDLSRLIELRGRVRRFLENSAAGQPASGTLLTYFRSLLESAPFVYTIGASGRLEVTPVRAGWRWVLAGIVSSAVEVASSGEARRIKNCANPDCSWLFYDETLNRSRRWCQVNYCGNLVKVRQHRDMRRLTASSS